MMSSGCSPPLDGGGDTVPGKPRLKTAESGGATSPTSTRRRPGRWSSKDIELECTRDCPLLPVGPLECELLDPDGREEFEPVKVCREEAAAEPEGLRDECGLR